MARHYSYQALNEENNVSSAINSCKKEVLNIKKCIDTYIKKYEEKMDEVNQLLYDSDEDHSYKSDIQFDYDSSKKKNDTTSNNDNPWSLSFDGENEKDVNSVWENDSHDIDFQDNNFTTINTEVTFYSNNPSVANIESENEKDAQSVYENDNYNRTLPDEKSSKENIDFPIIIQQQKIIYQSMIDYYYSTYGENNRDCLDLKFTFEETLEMTLPAIDYTSESINKQLPIELINLYLMNQLSDEERQKFEPLTYENIIEKYSANDEVFIEWFENILNGDTSVIQFRANLFINLPDCDSIEELDDEKILSLLGFDIGLEEAKTALPMMKKLINDFLLTKKQNNLDADAVINMYNGYFLSEILINISHLAEMTTMVNNVLRPAVELAQQILVEKETIRQMEIYHYGTEVMNSDNFEIYLEEELKKYLSEEQLQYLEEDEASVYTYLMKNNRKNEAKYFIQLMETTMRQRQGLVEASYLINDLIYADGDWLYDFSRSNIEGIKDGLVNFGMGFVNLFSPDGEMSVQDYKVMYITQMLSGYYLDEVAKTFGKDSETYLLYEKMSEMNFHYRYVLQMEYNLGSSFGNMLPSMAISFIPVIGKPIALGVSGLSTMGNAVESSYQRGAVGFKAYLYGAIVGTSEVAMQYLLGGIPGLSQASGLSIKSLLGETIEESLQNLLDISLKYIFFGEETDFKEICISTLESGLQGLLMSFGMNATIASVKSKNAFSHRNISNFINTDSNGKTNVNIRALREYTLGVVYSDNGNTAKAIEHFTKSGCITDCTTYMMSLNLTNMSPKEIDSIVKATIESGNLQITSTMFSKLENMDSATLNTIYNNLDAQTRENMVNNMDITTLENFYQKLDVATRKKMIGSLNSIALKNFLSFKSNNDTKTIEQRSLLLKSLKKGNDYSSLSDTLKDSVSEQEYLFLLENITSIYDIELNDITEKIKHIYKSEIGICKEDFFAYTSLLGYDIDTVKTYYEILSQDNLKYDTFTDAMNAKSLNISLEDYYNYPELLRQDLQKNAIQIMIKQGDTLQRHSLAAASMVLSQIAQLYPTNCNDILTYRNYAKLINYTPSSSKSYTDFIRKANTFLKEIGINEEIQVTSKGLVFPTKKFIYNEVDYTTYFPSADWYISDSVMLESMQNMSSEFSNCKTLEEIGIKLKNAKENGRSIKTTFRCFQGVDNPRNFTSFNGSIGRPGNAMLGGSYCGTTSLVDMTNLKDNNDYCSMVVLPDGTTKFAIHDMNNFGKVILGGVELNQKGVYMIEIVVPINNTDVAIPSVFNGGYFDAYAVPSGKTLGGTPEVTISPSSLYDGTLVKYDNKNNVYYLCDKNGNLVKRNHKKIIITKGLVKSYDSYKKTLTDPYYDGKNQTIFLNDFLYISDGKTYTVTIIPESKK